MKMLLTGMIIGVAGLVIEAQAIDIFGKTTKEIETNFLRPLSDIKNTITNTGKIFQNIESPTDRLRVAGGFVKEISLAMDKLISFTEFLNNKFINSILSQTVHSKVKEVVDESHAVLELLKKIGDEMRMYAMNEGLKEPVLRSGSFGDASSEVHPNS